jgi:hypothetical protein
MSNQKVSFISFFLISEQPTHNTYPYKIQYQFKSIIMDSSTLLFNIILFYLYNNTLFSTGGLCINRCGYEFFCIVTAAPSTKKCIYVVKLHLILYLRSKSRSSGTPRKLKWFIAEIEVHMLPHATYNERQSTTGRCLIYIYLVATIIFYMSINLHYFLLQCCTWISNKLLLLLLLLHHPFSGYLQLHTWNKPRF